MSNFHKKTFSKIFFTNYQKAIFRLDPRLKYVILCDALVKKLYGNAFFKELKNHKLNAFLFSIPASEEYKTRLTKEKIEDQLIQKRLSKDTCIIGLGGGIILDLAGFIAATYCRGVDFISIPTTLLAMIDASIGGKVALNVGKYKNWIGTFYPAKEIWIDKAFLTSLTEKEMRNGLAEMIKYGILTNPFILNTLEKKSSFTHLIPKCIQIKKSIVKKDFCDCNKRHVLNFGHTIAHALEGYFSYKISHGEAVALGIVFESYLSYLLGYLSLEDFKRIYSLISSYDYPLFLFKKIPLKDLTNQIQMDKKNKEHKPYFVLLNKIGKPLNKNNLYSFPVDKVWIKKAYEYFQN